jgi:serine/threonine protein phosphatase PrpC
MEIQENAPLSSVRAKGMRIEVAAATHIGRRAVNADSYLIDEAAGLYCIADGLGDTPRSPEAAARRLVDEAIGAGGGRDNATAVLVGRGS